MKKINIIIYLTSISIFFFCFCNSHNMSKNYLYDRCNLKSQGFNIDTPKGNLYQRILSNNEYLSLKQINYVSDTFFLRLIASNKNKYKVFEFSYYNSVSIFKIYTFILNITDGNILFNKSTDKKENYLIYLDTIKNDSNNFIAELKSENILDLLDCHDIDDYDNNEVESISIEFSSKCGYKLNSYPKAFYSSKCIKESQHIANFLSYLKKQFNY